MKKGFCALGLMIIFCFVSGCSSTPPTTYFPQEETTYCQQEPDSAICIGLFKKTVDTTFQNYEYMDDLENYGVPEKWAPLREKNGKLVGDCEDCVITLTNALVKAGLPADNITLYLALPENSAAGHIIMGYGKYYVDCSSRTILSTETKHQLLSKRTITDTNWSAVRAKKKMSTTNVYRF